MVNQATMPRRAKIKRRARERVFARYGACVGVMVTYGALVSLPNLARNLIGKVWNILNPLGWVMAGATNLFIAVIFVEICFFFLRIYRGEETAAGEFFSGLGKDLGRKIKAALWKELYLSAWTALLFFSVAALFFMLQKESQGATVGRWGYALAALCAIAAMVGRTVKLLSYAQQYYILRDCPQVSARESLRLSIRMMKGSRGKLFVLHLSFLGWVMATAAPGMLIRMLLPGTPNAQTIANYVTGITSSFFLGQYVFAAEAGFYDELKRTSLAAGVISQLELTPDSIHEQKRRRRYGK